MRRRLLLSYDGSEYVGWQRQKNGRAVQAVVEEALEQVLDESMSIVGAGRTDAGVHARGQVAHFDSSSGLPAKALIIELNRRLPASVRVLHADAPRDDFHAQRSAVAKRYAYRWCRRDVIDPFRRAFVTPLSGELDVPAMRRAARCFEGEHDFAAFAKTGGSPGGTTVRRILKCAVEPAGDELRLLVTGSGFLRGMVRAMSGTLVEVGRGRRSVAGIGELLQGGSRADSGPNAPAQGLILERVYYPPALAMAEPAAGAAEESPSHSEVSGRRVT